MVSSIHNNVVLLALGVASAFSALCLAQTPDFDKIFTPMENEAVEAGSEFTITWETPEKYKDSNIKITLIGGPDQQNLNPVHEIAHGVRNSDETYSWAVDRALGADEVYGLVFSLEEDANIYQYSMPFKIAASKASPEMPETKTHSDDCSQKPDNLARIGTLLSPTNFTRGALNETTFRIGNGTTFRGKGQTPRPSEELSLSTGVDDNDNHKAKTAGASTTAASSTLVILSVALLVFNL